MAEGAFHLMFTTLFVLV